MMTAEQLKNSILQLALQGRLVDQNPADESAQKLLERIRAEKKTKIKAGTIPNDKKMEDVSEDEQLFDLPENWIWTRMGELFQHNTGKALNGTNKDGEVLTYITTSNLYWNRFELDNLKSMPFTESEVDKYTVTKGDLLVCEGGDYGRAAIWNYDFDMRIQNHVHRLRAYLPLCTEYFYYVINFLKGTGLIKGKGIAIQGLSSGALHNLVVPLPPLEEQKRIVAKIEELMPFVEQYAKASTRLNTLNASFPDQMKKSILQQAVMGKLVPQDPNDEPASVLLKKIAKEKQNLIKEGKIKKQKALPTITENEIPFDIPESWEWVQLDELVIFENGDRGKNYPNKSEYVQSGVAWINTGHIKPSGYLTTSEMNYITREKFESLRSGKIEANDLVFCLRGATYGKVSRVEPYTEGAVASSLMIIRPIISILRDYLLLYLKTPLAFSELAKYANGSAQPNLGAKDVRKYLVPLPPLKEQKRILECVEEILPKLDDLRK